MRYACKRDLHERCNGGWCTCGCHQVQQLTIGELREQKAAIEAEAAKLRELQTRLEGATEEVTPNESP